MQYINRSRWPSCLKCMYPAIAGSSRDRSMDFLQFVEVLDRPISVLRNAANMQKRITFWQLKENRKSPVHKPWILNQFHSSRTKYIVLSCPSFYLSAFLKLPTFFQSSPFKIFRLEFQSRHSHFQSVEYFCMYCATECSVSKTCVSWKQSTV